MIGMMNKKLALLCALMMVLTAIGGVAGAANETAVVEYVYWKKNTGVPGMYDIWVHAVSPGRFSYVAFNGLINGSPDIPAGHSRLFGPVSNANWDITFTDSTGTFSIISKPSDDINKTFPNENYNPPAPPPATTTTDPLPEAAPDYPSATISKIKSPITAYAKPDKTSLALEVQVKPGEAIKIIEYTYGGDWYRILYNDGNNAGWVPAKFIKMD